MKEGDTFRVRGGDPHLWMVLSDPTQDPDRIVCVMFTTLRGKGCDQTCVVEAGEHRFVVHPTIVQYSAAKVVPIAAFYKLDGEGRLQLDEPLSADLLARIRACAEDSRFIPNESYSILRSQGFAP